MSERQKAILSLTLAAESCRTALLKISEPPTKTIIDLAVLHKDLLSLLALLRSSTTKVALALKPSSPEYRASISPLNDISAHVTALSHCVHLFNEPHGLTLRREIVTTSRVIIESLVAFVRTFLTVEAQDKRESTGQAGDEYMVRTGAVHHLIDQASSPDGLSKDNLLAVTKIWRQNQAALDDGLKEMEATLEDAQLADDDQSDDGWDELGLTAPKMTDKEIERAKKILDVVRLTTRLHKRFRITFTVVASSPSSSYIAPPSGHIDTLPALSSDILIASDDLISTVYGPQNMDDLQSHLKAYEDVMHRTRSSLEVLLPRDTLEGRFNNMTVTPSADAAAGLKNPTRWFDDCFDQIDTVVRSTINPP